MATSNTKVIKEIITDVGGNTTIEYSDDTTQKYNVADVVTAQSNPLTGGIEIPALVGAGVVRDYQPDADLILHPAPPTISHIGPGGFAPFTVDQLYAYNDQSAANLMGFLPKYLTQFGTDYYENAASDTWTPPRYAVEFDFFGQDICLRYRARTVNPYFWVWVDGQPCSLTDAVPSGITPSPGSIHRVRLLFPSAAARRVRIYCELADYGGLEVPAGSMCIATDNQMEKIAVVGDSWAEGTAYTTPFNSLSSVIGRRLGVVPYISAQGGTGFVAVGGASKSAYGSTGRLATVSAIAPTSILFIGTINDRPTAPAVLQAAVTATFQAYKIACPGAKIFAAGVECTSNTVSGTDAAINAAISAAAASQGVPYLDMLSPAFIPRAGMMSALMGADGSHPTTLGAAQVADRIASWLRPKLQFRR